MQKTSAAAANINRQMTTDGIGKIYLAVTDRKVMDKEKKLIDYLYRDGRKNMSFATEKKTPGAKKRFCLINCWKRFLITVQYPDTAAW